MDDSFLWLAGFVLLSFTTQAMSGFGSVIIAVTLGSRFYPIEVLLPVVVPLDVLINAYIVTRTRAHVDRAVLFREIVPFMAVGLGSVSESLDSSPGGFLVIAAEPLLVSR